MVDCAIRESYMAASSYRKMCRHALDKILRFTDSSIRALHKILLTSYTIIYRAVCVVFHDLVRVEVFQSQTLCCG